MITGSDNTGRLLIDGSGIIQPPGFRRLEYMRFFNRCVFVTDVIPTRTTGIQIDYAPRGDIPTDVTISASHPYGCIDVPGSANVIGGIRFNKSGNTLVTPGFSHFSANIPISASYGVVADGGRHVCGNNWMNSRVVTWDGKQVGTLNQNPASVITWPMGIGCLNVPTPGTMNTSYVFLGDMCRIKISEGNAVIKDYVPCLDAGGVLCWLCLITGHVARRNNTSPVEWPTPGPVVETPAPLLIRGWREGEDFLPAVSPVEAVESSAGSALTTVKDSIFRDDYPAVVRADAQVFALTIDGAFAMDGPVSFVSRDTSKLTVDAGGLCRFVGAASGAATVPVNVTCKSPTWQDSATRQIPVTVSRASGQTVRRLDSRVAGSLAAYLDAQVAARTALVAPTDKNRSLYSATNWAAKTATRNPASILADMDISPMVVMNSLSREKGQGGGVLVTSRDVLLAHHYIATWANGIEVIFLGKSGATHMRTIVDSRRVGTTDIRLCRLDSPLPGDVSVAKVFDGDIATRLPTSPRGFAAWTSGQERRVGVRYTAMGTGAQSYIASDMNPYTGQADPWAYPIVTGDSGSPAFVFVDGAYVVIGLWTTATTGPMPGGYLTECNAALAAMGGTATLTVTDVTGYTTF